MARPHNIIARSRFAVPTVLGAIALPSLASAQFNNDWVGFAKENSRLVSASNVGVGDVQEKDYDWADLDNDGDVDLVSVRKQPFTTSGRQPNVLFMNQGGILVDRTADYASASDVAGDQGFLTPTNDRDVVIADVDQDGWLDVITATTLSQGQPKHISHPRIYMNLGNDANGDWQGLRNEDARFPQLFAGNLATFPRFCGVHAGDVTGDGYPDLYFSDYDSGGSGGGDLNDRLLINDGTGVFADETAARMTSQMTNTSFGTEAYIVDMNLDGVNDVVKSESGLVSMQYNNPNNEGFFNLYQSIYSGAPYHVGIGDLNNDGRPDAVISDDGADRIMYNLSNDALGRVNWGPPMLFGFVTGFDDGFGSNDLIVDLDGDGWNDAIISDVDVDIPGCNRRAHIYHNPGGSVGAQIQLKEEAGDSQHGNWRGVEGVKASDLTGMHDVAVFDIDGDGHNDMVFGRCSGTSVWINDAPPGGLGTRYCTPNTPNSTNSSAEISASGSAVASDNDLTLFATQLPPNQFGYFLTSETQSFIPNPGGAQGNLCLGGQIARFNLQVQNSGSAGEFSIIVDLAALPTSPPMAVMAGDTWNFTTWYRDQNPNTTSNFTDAIAITFQ